MPLGRRFAAISTALVTAAAGLVAAPSATAVTSTLDISCAATRSYDAPRFIAKDDNLVLTATDGSCDGFPRPTGSFNFTGSSGAFTNSGGSITLTSRKQLNSMQGKNAGFLVSLTDGPVTVTINNPAYSTALTFVAATPTTATINQSYSYQFDASGSPIVYTLSSGTLPTGLSLSSDGELAGTPTVAGTYTFVVEAYNQATEASPITTPSISMTIAPASSWTDVSPPAAQIGSDYGSGGNGYQFNAGLAGTTSYTVTSGALPSGLALSASGLLTGRPVQVGTFTFEITATDTDNNSSATSGTLSITTTAPQVDKVTICHRTRATTNPYVLITVSVNSIVKNNGHKDHNTTRTNSTNPTNNNISPGSGPFDTSFQYPSNQKWWGDIIPPFTYSGGTFPGLNWDSNWYYPDPTSGTSSWLEDGEFAAAVRAGRTANPVSSPPNPFSSSSIYDKAAAMCLDLTNGQQSTESTEMDSPDKYFAVSIRNGESPEAIREDLVEQEALSMGGNSPGSGPITIDPVATLEDTYSSAAKVATDTASGIGRTSATLNGTLKSGSNWNSWTFDWGTSESDVLLGNGSSQTDSSLGGQAGPLTPDYEVTGLTCATTYYFRITGTDNASPATTSVGLIRTFTTSSCPGNSGGGNSGGGNSGGGNGNSGGGNSGNNPGTGTTTPPGQTPTVGGGRPPRLTLPPAGPANRPVTPGNSSTPGNSNPNSPGNGDDNDTTSTPGTNGTSTPGSPANPLTTVYRPRNLTPTTSVPAPPGTEWEPTQTRIQDPETGEPVLRVTTEAGTWAVDERSGAITYTPSTGFAGSATVNVVLVARSGEIYIHPMRVPISFTSRVKVVSGDVPRDISGGVARIIRLWQR